MLPLETPPPPGDPSGWVVSLWTVLSPEQASHMWMFLNNYFYREGLLAPRPTPKLEDHPSSAVRDCSFQFIRSYPPYPRPFLYPQPADAPRRGDRDTLSQGNEPVWSGKARHVSNNVLEQCHDDCIIYMPPGKCLPRIMKCINMTQNLVTNANWK